MSAGSGIAARTLRFAVALLTASAAIGCGSSSSSSSPAESVTFTKDVAPIVFAQCAPCHRPGGAAPFSLLTYADVAKNADAVAEQTLARHMPPWLPERSEFPIVGERRLRDDQIDIIQRWAKGGAIEGNAADLPPAPAFTDGWQLGKPDVIVTTEQPYTTTPGGEDIYRNLVLRTSLTSGVFVRAVEFKTNGAPIHHAVIRVDRTTASRRRDGEDGQPGFPGMSWQNVQDPDGHFIGWAPGRGPIVTPDGMPWPLERGADLVVEVHLMPSTQTFAIQPTIGLFLSPTPPVHTPLTVKMGSKTIDIPAGQADYLVTDTYDLPVPVDLISVYPHAHYLGKDMLATATLPDGTVKTLLHIPHWSFHWQQDYRYATPIALPRGTRLTMRYTYDNSAANEHNPNRPPARVRAGPRSVDEMAEFGLQLLPKSKADAALLASAFEARDRLANQAMAEARVRDDPDNAEYRGLLGGLYVEGDRMADAMPHLEAAIRLGDRSSGTYNAMGIALMARGRLADAVTQFRRAASLAPRDERIPFNLGNALSRLSRAAEAEAAYRRSIAINPDFPDAHVNLAVLLFAVNKRQDALSHYARAAALRPDSVVIHSNYGGALAAAGRYTEAMAHTRRALAIDPSYAPALDNFRRLQRMGIK